MNNIIQFPKRRRAITLEQCEHEDRMARNPRYAAHVEAEQRNPMPEKFEWRNYSVTMSVMDGLHGKVWHCLCVYRMNSKARVPKPVMNYRYPSAEKRDAAWDEFKSDIVKREVMREVERAAKQRERAAGHGIKQGDCLVASWGYDQTNVDFFQVVRVSKSSVWFRAIGSEQVEGSEGFMSNRVRPVKDAFLSGDCVMERKRGTHCKRVQKSGDSYYVSHSRLHLRPTSWESDHYCSWYH